MHKNNSPLDNNSEVTMEDISLPVFSEKRFENSEQHRETEFENNRATQHTYVNREVTTSQRIITHQPSRGERIPTSNNDTGIRRPVPISIIEREEFGSSFHAPIYGLDFMRNADQFIIQENCDLTDLLANTENRYTVKIPKRENSEAIYYATESSKSCHRTFFGSGRAFSMRLYDKSDQEAMSFKRRLACGYCTFCVRLQQLEVWIPPGELVGTICQKWKPLRVYFEVCNRHDEVLYIIEGINSFSCFHKAEMFQIYTSDGSTQIGTIHHQWDPVSTMYQLHLQMPSSITDNRHKALLLGASFLLEYMFFESAQKRLNVTCMC
ncbi:phospholipid scramblase family member 5-like isoform X2 [Sitophilus oryzae]|uniref:Phospholipid scramblase n=1 Tax=Sitophilus oryzae TaxID=7048 RepID=A0A6J2XY09_SITOR|nr:phospholipid scramblase family member 5-like isoform X2 [Sitophilus oryzae]